MKGTDGKMSEREKIIAIIQYLGLGIEYKSGEYYDEINVYDYDKYLGTIVFKDDELIIDFM